MIRLQPTQLDGKLHFINQYIQAKNAADGSKMDANANVTQKKHSDNGTGANERFFCANQPSKSE